MSDTEEPGRCWRQNVARIKELFAQGQWGGVHAVYNIYNATRLTELFDWAKGLGIDTHWQSLYQPECLDPLKHNQRIRDLAQQEIQAVLNRLDLTNSERDFFVRASQIINLYLFKTWDKIYNNT
jgi:hypothetical protein